MKKVSLISGYRLNTKKKKWWNTKQKKKLIHSVNRFDGEKKYDFRCNIQIEQKKKKWKFYFILHLPTPGADHFFGNIFSSRFHPAIDFENELNFFFPLLFWKRASTVRHDWKSSKGSNQNSCSSMWNLFIAAQWLLFSSSSATKLLTVFFSRASWKTKTFFARTSNEIAFFCVFTRKKLHTKWNRLDLYSRIMWWPHLSFMKISLMCDVQCATMEWPMTFHRYHIDKTDRKQNQHDEQKKCELKSLYRVIVMVESHA